MANKIQIDASAIRNFQVQLEDLANMSNHRAEASQWLNDDSAKVLNSATNSLLKSSLDVTRAVKHLNDYLDKVANEFEAKDSELQAYLDSGFKSESHYDNAQKRLSRLNRAVRDSKYYQVLPD